MEERNEQEYTGGEKPVLKANELRIGNLVSKDGNVFEADFITIHMAHNYEQIPLTEEWLVKFGFDKLDIKHYDGSVSVGVFKKCPLVIEINRLNEGGFPFRVCRLQPSVMNQYNFICFCEHVHQLQNLYFALTGEELTIK